MRKKVISSMLVAGAFTLLPATAHAQVDPCVVEGPGSAVATPTDCPTTTPPGRVRETPSESETPPGRTRELPQTGIDTLPLALSGLGILAAGGTAVYRSRRNDG